MATLKQWLDVANHLYSPYSHPPNAQQWVSSGQNVLKHIANMGWWSALASGNLIELRTMAYILFDALPIEHGHFQSKLLNYTSDYNPFLDQNLKHSNDRKDRRVENLENLCKSSKSHLGNIDL
jgi:hypothetical protein